MSNQKVINDIQDLLNEIKTFELNQIKDHIIKRQINTRNIWKTIHEMNITIDNLNIKYSKKTRHIFEFIRNIRSLVDNIYCFRIRMAKNDNIKYKTHEYKNEIESIIKQIEKDKQRTYNKKRTYN